MLALLLFTYGDLAMRSVVHLDIILTAATTLSLTGIGFHLRTLRHSLQSESARRLSDVSTSQYLQAEAGVDIYGHVITALPATIEDRGLIFLIRGASLKADTDFWRSAAKIAAQFPNLRLVGYCDGQECAERLRSEKQTLPFPVIAFGELLGTQALFEADGDGEAVVHSERWFVPKNVEWRSTASTPGSVIDGATK